MPLASAPKAKAKSKRPRRRQNDPVVGEYDVYLNAQGELDVYLCQYPTRSREHPLTEENDAKPCELRIKPNAGIMEVDVPINTQATYDKGKGVTWGEALRKSNLENSIGSQGLPGGFGVGSVSDNTKKDGAEGKKRGGKAKLDDPEPQVSQAELLANFEGANARGRVLNKTTFGGKIPPKTEASPIYMVGAFRGKELHLTPLKSIIQLTPQFHHIDALHEREQPTPARAPRRDDNDGKDKEAKAVQMSNKPVMDGEVVDMSTTVETLKAFQEESWQRYNYEDENSATAWDSYDKFFLPDAKNAPNLKSVMTNGEFLDALSDSPLPDSQRSEKSAVPGEDRASSRNVKGDEGSDESE
ncbi:MAG: hypothetical protein M1837_001137 [Sclerophora amabilis]|nr:MAG: hypothetical protein M1837_001137 [Sclerophora amabilis]